MAVPGWTVRLSAELTPNLGTVIGAACAQAALMVALAAWLRADIRALETTVRADFRALDGRVNILARTHERSRRARGPPRSATGLIPSNRNP